MSRRLKNIRLAVSVFFGVVAITAITTAAIGLGVTGGWITKLQIVPLILSAGVPMLIAWLIVTFVFGRVYCSSVCPLGTLQDCISRVASIPRRGHRYHYTTPVWSVRWLFLIIMILALTSGTIVLTITLDPYAGFAKIIDGVGIPAFTLGAIAVSLSIAVAGMATLLVVMFFSAYRGRLLCNTLCPVGTGLGLMSIQPVFRIDINTDLCTGCNKCVEVCKSSCIDPSSHTVDTTRCVVCFNCTAVCSNKAITYTCNRHRLQRPMLMQNR